MELQRSALHSVAVAAGCGFVERQGWELPAAYTDLVSEYRTATTGVGVYDASHMGRLAATGDDALDLLHRLSTNSVLALEPDRCTPTILTTDRGRILDVITVVHAEDHLLLVTSPSMQGPVTQFLDKYTILEDLTVEDVSSSTAMLALLGPASREFLQAAAGVPLSDLQAHQSLIADLHGCQVRIVACGVSDLLGFYLISTTDMVAELWQRVVAEGATRVGEDAYEVARINNGVPVQGRDFGEEHNPLEAGLIGSVDFTKGCYIGQEVIARLDSYHKVQKYLVKLEFGQSSVVSPGAVLNLDGKAVGKVTSAAHVPGSRQQIGLAYVRTKQAISGTQLQLASPAAGTALVKELSQMFGPGQD